MLCWAAMEGPSGIRLRIGGSDTAISAIEFGELAEPARGRHPLVEEAVRQLRAYFEGRLWRFDLPLDPRGTPFQLRVWRELLAIPYGETRSYRWVAERAGSPTAVRAAGAANGSNPIAIVVPCHRVIGSNGKLTGYGGGLPLKRTLLELEARHAWRSRAAQA
jgi:methylated-DNA-[protein]-cysteine S-methyltransferase